MRSFAAKGLAALLLLMFLPGTGELLENAAHWVRQGHPAHGTPEGDEHASPGPEHGCTGTMHVCFCCASPRFLPTEFNLASPGMQLRPLVFESTARLSSDFADGVYHPPKP